MSEQDGRAERVLRQSRALGDDVRGLAQELGEAAREVREKVDVTRSVQAHPFRTVLIAAGLGYVIGGGLFSPLTARLLGLGTRAMLIPLLKGQLEALAAGAMNAREH
jgi:hypothetical protein